MSRSAFSYVFIISLALAACGDSSATQKKAAAVQSRAVVVEVVKFQPRQPQRSYVGSIRPRVESDLGFRVAGKVAERLVQQGERVKAGQILFKLDPVDLALQHEQAAAEVSAARISLQNSAMQDQRSQDLKKSGWLSQANLDQQVSRTADARSRLERAERAMSLAQNQQTYAEIKADADGIVTATLAEPGQVVAPGAPVVRIARTGESEAVVAIPEMHVESLRGSLARVALWANPQKSYPAILRELAAAADPATRTFQARFALENPDPAVAIGMTATVTVSEADAGRVARLPVSALYADGRGPSLFVVDPGNGQLSVRPVAVVGYEGANVLVASGVSDGEQIVAFGVQKLDATQKVRVIEKRG